LIEQTLATCFHDRRCQELSSIALRRCGAAGVRIALGYEDINDHDELRHDPTMRCSPEAGAGGRTVRRAGKSTLNALN